MNWKSHISLIALSSLLSLAAAQAAEIQWLEGGNTVNASQSDIQAKGNDTDNPVEATLATGVVVTLSGGVYVKADDTNVVLAWAQANNYVAEEDQFIPNAINVQTIPEQSITVANAIAELDGVTTAMPNYRAPLVPK